MIQSSGGGNSSIYKTHMIPKIVITIERGIVTKVHTTLPESLIAIVDIDRDAGEDALWLYPPEGQDGQFENGRAYLLFEAACEGESEAINELKRLKF
jgi:hypothetical protein